MGRGRNRGRGNPYGEANWEKAERKRLNKICRELDAKIAMGKAAIDSPGPNRYEREAPPDGGTFNSTVFESKQKADGSTHHYFNSGPNDGEWHGHVIEEPDGSYRHVRDADGMQYDT